MTTVQTMPMPRMATLLGVVVTAGAAVGSAHDTWVQASQRLMPVGDVVHIGLFLGNHGNDHRDFKLAGKVSSLEGSTLEVIGPDGSRTDLVPDAVDVGYAPKEGFWSSRFVPGAQGLHGVAHTRIGVHLGKRGVKSGKTYFMVAEKLDAPPAGGSRHTEPLGHPLELVAETNPALGTGPGRPLALRLLFRGQPLSGHRVSFIPRGVELKEGFDDRYERLTDAEGRCSFEPREGNLILVVAHVDAPEERGPDHDRTVYSATLVIDVPQRCPCCEE